MFGWAAGAGLDWKWQIDPGSAWVLGIEYLHYQFPEHTIAMGDQFGSGLIFGFNQSSLSVDTIKGRISYLFSIHQLGSGGAYEEAGDLRCCWRRIDRTARICG
jgi:hypothetical protein